MLGIMLCYHHLPWWASLAQMPAMQETQVRSLDWEDPLEKRMATPSSICAWRIPWTEEPNRQQSVGSQETDTTEQLTHTYIHRENDKAKGASY